MDWFKNWDHHVDLADVFHHTGMTYEERRDAICQRLEQLKITDSEFFEAVEELRHAEDTDEFDYVFATIYDWADDGKRLWIMTMRPICVQ